MLKHQKIMFNVWSKGYVRLFVELFDKFKTVLIELIDLIKIIIAIVLSPIVFIIMLPFAGIYDKYIKKSNLKFEKKIDKEYNERN